MSKELWEYKTVILGDRGLDCIETQECLNEMGKMGWELIVVSKNYYPVVLRNHTSIIFKRKID